MSQQLTNPIVDLDKKLDATLDAIANVVKAIEGLKVNDGGFIFHLDLAKHALNEAGYPDTASNQTPEESH